MIEKLEQVDEILASYEDWMHGTDGENCTKARKLLIEVIKEVKNISFNPMLAASWKELQIEKPLKETEYLLYCEIFEDVFGQEGNTQNFYEVGYWDGKKFNTAYGKDGDDLKESEIKFWSELPCSPACR